MIKKNLLEYQLNTQILFGNDIVYQVVDYAKNLGDKVIILTNGSVFNKLGYVNKIKSVLEKSNLKIIVYEDVHSNIKSDEVDDIGELVRKSKANLIIGLGSTTVINVTKAVALLATNPGSINDYLNGQQMKESPVPFILIPTIPGTYFDLSHDFILTDYTDNYKRIFRDPKIEATVDIIDAKIMTTLPLNFTAASALNILVNAVESYISTNSNPISHSLAPRAIEYLMRSLKSVITDRENIEFRWDIAMAGILSSMATRITGLGASSSMGFVLSARYNIYEHVAKAIMLPHIMEFNLTSVPGKYVQIAKNMGEDVASVTIVEAAIKAIESVRKLLFDLKIPQRLSEYQVPNEDLPLIAGHAQEYHLLEAVPRPISKDDLINILISAT